VSNLGHLRVSELTSGWNQGLVANSESGSSRFGAQWMAGLLPGTSAVVLPGVRKDDPLTDSRTRAVLGMGVALGRGSHRC
jgi:hypothetical protein